MLGALQRELKNLETHAGNIGTSSSSVEHDHLLVRLRDPDNIPLLTRPTILSSPVLAPLQTTTSIQT